MLKLTGVSGTPGDGPYVAVELDLNEQTGRVVGARFGSNGCRSARHATHALGEFAIGRTLDQLSRLEAGDLEIIAGALIGAKSRYYEMAVEALGAAIEG